MVGQEDGLCACCWAGVMLGNKYVLTLPAGHKWSLPFIIRSPKPPKMKPEFEQIPLIFLVSWPPWGSPEAQPTLREQTCAGTAGGG